MKIQTIGTFTSVINKIEKKDKEFTSFLLKTGVLLNGKIQRRVQIKGYGSKGRKLKRYSRGYTNRRKKTGRQIAFRDLTWSRRMFASLTATIIGNKKVQMFFGGAEERAKAYFNDKKTPFFSLSPNEQSDLHKELEDFAKL